MVPRSYCEILIVSCCLLSTGCGFFGPPKAAEKSNPANDKNDGEKKAGQSGLSAEDQFLLASLKNGGNGSVKGLETVLKKPEELDPLILWLACGVAFKEKRLEDSGFLYLAGNFRADFDFECFTSKDTGGSSPLIAYKAMQSTYSDFIPFALMDEPKVFEKVLDRVKNWKPKAPKDYHPEYEFTERKTEQAAQEAVKAKRTKVMEAMIQNCTLLNDREYFAAFRIVRAFNAFGGNATRPTKEEYEKASQTLKRISKEKGSK